MSKMIWHESRTPVETWFMRTAESLIDAFVIQVSNGFEGSILCRTKDPNSWVQLPELFATADEAKAYTEIVYKLTKE